MSETIHLQTGSPAETEALGQCLSSLVPMGTVVALHGDLGAGKTCFVRGMARAFVHGDPVSSPTFTLVNEYGEGETLYHLDLYRLESPEELADLGFEELFDSPDGLCVVEWPERAGALLPPSRVDVHLAHAGGDRRDIAFSATIPMPDYWGELLKAVLGAEAR